MASVTEKGKGLQPINTETPSSPRASPITFFFVSASFIHIAATAAPNNGLVEANPAVKYSSAVAIKLKGIAEFMMPITR